MAVSVASCAPGWLVVDAKLGARLYVVEVAKLSGLGGVAGDLRYLRYNNKLPLFAAGEVTLS